MAEPLKKIGKVKETGWNNTGGGLLKREKGKKRHWETENGSVDISDEARSRATDKIKV